MNPALSRKSLESVLEDILSLCRETFGNDLVSVVLFGSYAQGAASPESDIDLLVIVKNLPEGSDQQEQLLDSLELPILKKYHLCASVILTTPEAVLNGVNTDNPLFFGIWTGYSVIFDSGDFFRHCLKTVRQHVRTSKPVFIDRRKRWNLAEI
jgi:uncharacterized protein